MPAHPINVTGGSPESTCSLNQVARDLALWKNADTDRPEITTAKEFLAKTGVAAQ